MDTNADAVVHELVKPTLSMCCVGNEYYLRHRHMTHMSEKNLPDNPAYKYDLYEIQLLDIQVLRAHSFMYDVRCLKFLHILPYC